MLHSELLALLVGQIERYGVLLGVQHFLSAHKREDALLLLIERGMLSLAEEGSHRSRVLRNQCVSLRVQLHLALLNLKQEGLVVFEVYLGEGFSIGVTHLSIDLG